MADLSRGVRDGNPAGHPGIPDDRGGFYFNSRVADGKYASLAVCSS
jgi:hypothetical protein